jgi:hypothetical protein
MNSAAKTLSATLIAIGLAGTSSGFAQNQSGQPRQTEPPAAESDEMQDMMQGGDMSGMMGMMQMMTQMNEMMGACTKMMQAMTPGEKKPEEQDSPG